MLLETSCEYELRIVNDSEFVFSFIALPEMLLQLCCEDEYAANMLRSSWRCLFVTESPSYFESLGISGQLFVKSAWILYNHTLVQVCDDSVAFQAAAAAVAAAAGRKVVNQGSPLFLKIKFVRTKSLHLPFFFPPSREEEA